MSIQEGRPPERKDLQDLRDLPRSPFMSYLQKQAPPPTPRSPAAKQKPTNFPKLSAFFSLQVFRWVIEYLSQRFGPRHDFLDYTKAGADNGVYPLEGEAGVIRIALAGDWGTGTDEADKIAQRIKAFQPHYSIHLGDVYYVGGPKEVNENFLGIKNPDNRYDPCLWPSGLKGTFSLNGNHEMYARGIAYFDNMLPKLGRMVNGRAQGQRASFFCLENEYWRFVAVDTGYNSVSLPVLEEIFRPDCALPPALLDWIRTVVRPTANDPRGIVILSHHQYFSAFDSSYPKPAQQLAEFFSRPVLWFWGHEHRMTIYQEGGVAGGIRAFGRCIGNGGMPVALPPPTSNHPQFPVEFVDRRVYQNDENLAIGFNGFVRLTVQANRLSVEYVDLNDTVLFTETWSVDRGTLARTAHRQGP
jgi:Calcineurin-like phosphoesterase